ncbi:MAG: Holliday junction branch migration protein RuvA [Helicobacteraceae bacterium]|nr:Holliday junction branch migration protein RuvA [Helicobacteraceae bacterium]
MIVGIEGIVKYKEPTFVHVNVAGIIYEIFISLNTYSTINISTVELLTTHIIREDAQLLYGFDQMSEKVMFDRLIKISGVGPKVGMAICSTFTSAMFAEVINSNDITSLKKVPGIGPKSAGRILVELSGFVDTLVESSQNMSSATREASLALESLGFKKEHISKVLTTCNSDDTATLVKEALKKLQKL